MKKLPVVGSTASTTQFCATVIEGPEGTSLWLDGNSKVTAWNGTFDEPMPNAFSLEAQAVVDRERDPQWLGENEHCPGSTPTCRKSCYVHGLEKHAKATYELYRHNSTMIRRILADESLTTKWVIAMADHISSYCKGGFRWHVSGDVFSAEYAEFIERVCKRSFDVVHWIYTRSFDPKILGPLFNASTANGGNLALNLSCDKDNIREAVLAADYFSHMSHEEPLRLCYLVEAVDPIVPSDLKPGDVIFPDYDLRPRSVEDPTAHPWWASLTLNQRKMVCPVDAFNKSETRRCGPCSRCMT